MKELPVALPKGGLVIGSRVGYDRWIECTGDDCDSLEIVGVTLFQGDGDRLLVVLVVKLQLRIENETHGIIASRPPECSRDTSLS